MNLPEELRYTEEHEWVRAEGTTAVVGITDFAQGELGDIVFVEMPDVGAEFDAGGECGTIEAVKTVAQLFAPVAGKVVEVNGDLEGDASLVNRDPYGEGWLMKIEMSEPGRVEDLLSADAYRTKVS